MVSNDKATQALIRKFKEIFPQKSEVKNPTFIKKVNILEIKWTKLWIIQKSEVKAKLKKWTDKKSWNN